MEDAVGEVVELGFEFGGHGVVRVWKSIIRRERRKINHRDTENTEIGRKNFPLRDLCVSVVRSPSFLHWLHKGETPGVAGG
jgi:hypothetical protein